MGDYTTLIKEITGLDEKEFIKLWKDRDREWGTGMKHIEEHGLRCVRMLNGEEQWDKGIEAQRRTDKRPVLSENLLPDFVNKPHGEFCMSTPQAIVDPVDGKGDQQVADVLKGIIYSTSYQYSGTSIHRDAFYSLLSSSLAAWRVNTKYSDKKSFNLDPTIEYIVNPFSVRWDLDCKEPDLSDKKWCFILQSMEKDEFIKQYGEDKWKSTEFGRSSGTEKDLWWAEEKATVAEVWWKQEDEFTLYEQVDGTTSREKPSSDTNEAGEKLRSRTDYDVKIYSCIISKDEVLTEPTEWPDYTDKPIIPIVIVHGRKIVVAGKIYYKAIVSDGLDIQQLHNYWITAITEMIALQPDAPYLATEAQIAGFEEWTDLSKKVRAMRYKVDPKAPGKPERQAPPQLSGAVMNMPQYTRQALRDVIGLQQASLGMQGNEKSGIAIQKRKQEGDAGKFSFIENMTRGIELEAKILINIIPSVMDTPRTVRIMGEDGSKRLAYLNRENPDSGEFLDISVGKYDARVTTGPTFATQRDEARDMLIQLVQYLGPIAPTAVTAIAPKFMKLINSPDAEEMARIIVATLPPQLQAFYANEDDQSGKMKKLPPEVLAQLQQMSMQLQQAQQVLQQQAQELDALKKEEAIQMRKLEAETGIEKEKLAVEREKIMRDITIKEKEIKAKQEIELQKINTDIELEMSKLMETFKNQKELKELDYQLTKRGRVPEQPPVQPELPAEITALPKDVADIKTQIEKTIEAVQDMSKKVDAKSEPAPLTVNVDARTGAITKKVSFTNPEGKEYTGQVTEGAQ
jgi:hypothetical protein